MAEITYRLISAGEAEDLHRLVMRAFDEFVAPDLPEGGREHFNDYASRARLGAPERRHETVVAVSEGRPVGVGRVGRRNEKPHIDLLFVEREMHGQGVGRELVRRLLAIARRSDPTAERVTVNATRYAVAFYARLGFTPRGEEQTVGGIISTPMEIRLAEERPIA
ncbi:MAG: GNAT family N-acetyltransferase [Chloroflexota bacterium]|nr:GNAT family N-acetyltransferase [Chloroflexota bacterium]MDE2884949.1 GNAT family N-acetyltransferase [Chloroflexota bacterium]